MFVLLAPRQLLPNPAPRLQFANGGWWERWVYRLGSPPPSRCLADATADWIMDDNDI